MTQAVTRKKTQKTPAKAATKKAPVPAQKRTAAAKVAVKTPAAAKKTAPAKALAKRAEPGTSAAGALYPERKRCKTCRGSLGKLASDPVLLGLYCCAKCASMSEPAATPEQAPRGCKTQRDGGWVYKKRYRHPGEAPDRLTQEQGMSQYWCSEAGGCGHLHFGRTLVEMKGTVNRGLRDRAAIADMLVKARGHATHSQVAKVAGVRPVRIKEWEDPGFDAPSLKVLFELTRLYRFDLAAVFRN